MVKTHKITKKVKCNGLVKRWTLDNIDSLTYMTIGEVYDCCESGAGVLSKMDSNTMAVIKRLNGLLRKIDFPLNVNKEFGLFLKNKKNSLRQQLNVLNDCISSGVKPIYYRDIFKQGGFARDDAEAHELEKRAFKSILNFASQSTDTSLFLEELEQKYQSGKLAKTYINPETRYERFLRQFYVQNNDNGKPKTQQMFDNAYKSVSGYLCGESFEIIAFEVVRTLINNPQSREELADEALYEASLSRLLYDDRYCFTTKCSHDYNSGVLSKRFRAAVEYISTIPSKSNPLLFWHLLEDCRIIEEDITRWKDFLRANKSDRSMISNTEKLIDTFNEKTKDLVVPSMSIDIAEDCFSDGFEYPFFEMLDANTIIYGVTAVGVEVDFEFKIEQEELNIIIEASQRIRNYKDSKDKRHRNLYQMYSRYQMDFLLRYIGLYELDYKIQKGGLNALCMIWDSSRVSKIKSYNRRFFEYYYIKIIEGNDEKGGLITRPI